MTHRAAPPAAACRRQRVSAAATGCTDWSPLLGRSSGCSHPGTLHTHTHTVSLLLWWNTFSQALPTIPTRTPPTPPTPQLTSVAPPTQGLAGSVAVSGHDLDAVVGATQQVHHHHAAHILTHKGLQGRTLACGGWGAGVTTEQREVRGWSQSPQRLMSCVCVCVYTCTDQSVAGRPPCIPGAGCPGGPS